MLIEKCNYGKHEFVFTIKFICIGKNRFKNWKKRTWNSLRTMIQVTLTSTWVPITRIFMRKKKLIKKCQRIFQIQIFDPSIPLSKIIRFSGDVNSKFYFQENLLNLKDQTIYKNVFSCNKWNLSASWSITSTIFNYGMHIVHICSKWYKWKNIHHRHFFNQFSNYWYILCIYKNHWRAIENLFRCLCTISNNLKILLCMFRNFIHFSHLKFKLTEKHWKFFILKLFSFFVARRKSSKLIHLKLVYYSIFISHLVLYKGIVWKSLVWFLIFITKEG